MFEWVLNTPVCKQVIFVNLLKQKCKNWKRLCIGKLIFFEYNNEQNYAQQLV